MLITTNIRKAILYAALTCVAACASDDTIVGEPEAHEFTLTSEVTPFKGETPDARGLIDGTGFENGDWIRLKIICPFSTSSEYGESTWGNSYDAFFLMKRKEGGWTYLEASDHCDINGSYEYSSSPQVESFYEAQQTPYVYMASTWSEEKNFKTANNSHVLQYCHVFHADQRKAKHYKASDLLWAQQYMQTGSWNVHLNFEHKMACITFELDDSGLTVANPAYDEEDSESSPTLPAGLTDNAVLTLEGMPDIDQQEVIVGDYYAPKSKINSGSYNYINKHSCLFDYNGRVIGIGVNVESKGRAYAYPMTGNPNPAYNTTFTSTQIIPNTGTYTAYKVDNTHYRLIVPPCVLTEKARIWVRDGERRFMMPLERLDFHEGELYPVTVKL